MSWHLWSAFVLATAVLMAIPGPNVALIVANSVGFGVRVGLLTVLATSAASLIQLGLAALGLSVALRGLSGWALELRWLGAVYLVAMGWRQWQAGPVDLTQVRPLPPGQLLARSLAVSLGNPKTLFFFGAFFPQFVSAEAPPGPQILLLAVTFLGVALAADSGWALLAGRARHVLAARARLRNRLAGGMLMGAGAGLALARHT